MSLPMPGMISVPSASAACSIAMTSGACGLVAGLTQTSPATSGCWSPVHSVSEPPMLSPPTTIRSARCGQALVGRLDLAGPVGPAGGEHVLDRGAVAGQAGQLDVEPGGGHGLGQAAHRRRVAGEAVEGQEPDGGRAVRGRVRPRLGSGQDLGAHGGRSIAACVRRRCAPGAPDAAD